MARALTSDTAPDTLGQNSCACAADVSAKIAKFDGGAGHNFLRQLHICLYFVLVL